MVDVRRANNVIRIPTSIQGTFFRIWIEFLTPLHNLTNREKDIIAALLKERFELSKAVSDNALLDKLVLSEDTKNKVKAECNVSDAFFQVLLGKLRKAKVIENGRINSKLIPKSLEKGDESFRLLLYFDFDA